MSLDLTAFFRPRAVALVGATDDLSKFGGRCLQQLLAFGFDGPVFPVNPKYAELRGRPCYASLADLPEPPDHVGIVVPPAHVIPTLRAAAARGARFATVFTAGYGETGTDRGRALEAELRAVARETGVRVMGPNCNGMINFERPFALTSTATINGPRRPAGDVGVVAQSGGVGQVNVMWRAQEAGLGISYEVSCGNDADLDALDFIDFMVEDDVTRVILTVLERVPDGDKLRRVARRAAERGKPILAIKLGRTEAGARAAASHTGALTGSDAVNEAALADCGIIRVDDCPDLYRAAMLLRQDRPAAGRRAAALSISGGNLVMLTDLGAARGLDWPDYDEATQRALATLLPAFGRAANPTDLTAAAIGTPGRFAEVLGIVGGDPNVDMLVPVVTFATAAEIRAVADYAKWAPKPVAMLWTGRCIDDAALRPETLVADGVAVYRDARDAMAALRAAADHGAFRRRLAERPAPRRPAGLDPDAARAALAGAGQRLSEREAKRVLAAYGIAVPPETLARTADDAVAAAAALGGPVALKIESRDIPHKTEAGAIRLGLAGADAVRAGFAAVMAAAARHRPDARLDGVLVQPMAPPGLEMIVGVSRDPTFGPVVTLGLGGIHAEILADVAIGLPPFDAETATRLLRGLRAAALLDGARGAPPRDVGALAGLVEQVAWLAHDLADAIAELDLNPVIALEAGAGIRIVDALIVRRETSS